MDIFRDVGVVRIARSQVEAFLDFSRDRNPLHWDEAYARRTPFGQIVVPGMCAVLCGLGRGFAASSGHIDRIRGAFRKPLFLDEEYTVQVSDTPHGELLINVGRGQSVSTEIRVSYSSPDETRIASADSAEPTLHAGRAEAYSAENVRYSPAAASRPSLMRLFGLAPTLLSAGRLSALAWGSFVVGMEYPGRQALFSMFDFVFDDAAQDNDNCELVFPRISGYLDERFRRATLAGEGRGTVRKFALAAYVRPEPVEYGLDEVASAFTAVDERFRDKKVLVTGGTRGFGAVLSRGFLLSGSHVIATYHKEAQAGRDLESEGASRTRRVVACPIDLTSEDDCYRLASRVRETFGTLDIVVHNAALPVRPRAFLEQSPAEFSAFVEPSIRMMSQLCYTVLPCIRPGGFFIGVSSAYTRELPQLFSHYVCYKIALEGLMQALAKEFTSLQFVVARPPRMLTDQTNLPFALESVVSAVPIARKLLDGLAPLTGTPGNYHALDLS